MLSLSVFPNSPVAPYCPAYVRAGRELAMERQGEEVHLNETEATDGVKAQGERYVLGISLLLVVIAMYLIWIIAMILT